MSYPTADALHNDAQQAFALHVGLALDMYPEAVPSHLCIRTASENDYNIMTLLGQALGELHEREHNGRKLCWVRLSTPLEAHNLSLNWLEITAPNPEVPHETGPQMLVYVLDVKQPVKIASPARADFILRFQDRGAEELSR